MASLVAQTVKRLPTMWETWVHSLGREDPLEKEMATHSSTLSMEFSRQEYWSGLPFPSPTISQSLLKFIFIEFMMLSNHLILCHPLLTPSMFPSLRVFSSELALHIRWPKYWSFNFSISLSNEYSGLISFRMDWLDLLSVQRTLKSLFQHHNFKASILWCSAFFMVQLLHPYMTTGKTIALIIWTFVSKVMSLLFNMLSRFLIAILSKSKHLLILWLQSPSTVIFGVRENKICYCFHYLPIHLP